MEQLRQMAQLLIDPLRAFRSFLDQPRSGLAFCLLVVSLGGAQLFLGSRLDRPAMERQVVRQAGGEKEISESDLQQQTQRALNLRRLALVGRALGGLAALWLALGGLFWLQLPRPRHSLGFFGSFKVALMTTVPLGFRALLSFPVIASYPSVDPAGRVSLFRTALGDMFEPPLPLLAWADPFWIWCAVLFALAGRAAGWGKIHSCLAAAVLVLLLGYGGRSFF